MSKYLPAVAILSLLLLILGGIFLWWPEYQKFTEEKAKLEAKITELKQKEEYYAGLTSISAQLAQYEAELKKIDSALPTEPSIVTLFYFVQKTAAENGLILQDINQQTGGTGGEAKTDISLSISVSGPYSALKNFLAALYNNIRLIDVELIKFTSPPEKTNDVFSVGLTLKTHSYQKPLAPEGEFTAPTLPK